jgi:hypothetical protein
MISQIKPWMALAGVVVLVLGVVGVIANVMGLFMAAGVVAVIAGSAVLLSRRRT